MGSTGYLLEPIPAVSGQGKGQVTGALTDWQTLPCKVSTAPQEQFGFQCLAQRHFDTQLSSAQ